MVEQICEKCGARYSLYAPACPKCGEPTAQPPKKPGCPQAPAPAPKSKPAANASSQDTGGDTQTDAGVKPTVTVTVETDEGCSCKRFALSPLALIGALVAVVGIIKLIRK